MKRLVYSCYAQRSFTDDDLLQIRDSARPRNTEWDLSGAMLYSKRRIVQVLEGTRDRLFDDIELLMADDRVGGLRIEAIEPCSERLFRGWDLHVASVSKPCPGRERVISVLISLFNSMPGRVAGTVELASCLSDLRTLIEEQDCESPQSSV